ncbi:LysM peptidoglycan-binding domain-containing protein [Cellulomonas sp. URHE0023]|uniref:LysM peptidoglycan-binding domain-containing protein n=1 Tax=Cellulomonas sp. URHE0023 TaxID=1380354 RepID=UPI000482C4DD|nr:LysM peptidoglycan-binding domain-containing protein [Cellulomonas sp. URHE0023]
MTTTLHRTHHSPEVLHALAALLALLAFVVGAPVALVALAPLYLPDDLPRWNQIGTALTSPDDGSLLLATLALIGWVAWAAFTTSVVVEVIAGLRRVSTPSIPLLGSAQWAAARLIASAGILLAVSSTVANPTPAAAATVTATPAAADPPAAAPQAARHAAAPAPTAPQTPPAATAPLPTVVVQRGDTLWDIAEQHLGDGTRFSEISTLNLDRIQPDGLALNDSHWIYPGWTLLLPADAAGLAPPPIPSDPSVLSPKPPHEVVVEPGDSLWKLADEHLGDGARYPEIYAINAGQPQPDGATLTNPNALEPGWRLDLPTQDTTVLEPPALNVAPPAPAPAPPQTTSELRPTSDTQEPEPAAPTPSASPKTQPNSDAASASRADSGTTDTGSHAPLFVGLTTLAAAGVVGELGRRRHLQHRARRVGESIPMPESGTEAAAVERELRRAATPLTATQLKNALQNIDTRCYTAERDLPRIAAVSLDERTLTLHLLDDDPDPVSPFTADGDRWTASTSDLAADELIEDPGRSEPYPALVPLGHTADATVLLNLEAAGTLSVLGDEHAADDVLRALAVEVVTSDLTGRVALVTDESLADLAEAFEPARMHSAPDHTRPQAVRTHAIAQALDDAGLADTLEARSDRVLEDTWLPVVYLERSPSTAPPCEPWTGSVLITREAVEGWTLTVGRDGATTLDPLGLTLHAQRLSDTDLEHVTSLLQTAQPPVVVPLSSNFHHDSPNADSPTSDEVAEAMRAAAQTRSTVPGTREGRIRVNVLGPIQIDGLTKPHSAPPPRATELLVYLALRRSASGPELDEIFWPGKRDVTGTRNTFVYRTRQLVGDDALPPVRRGEPLRVTDDVVTDWATFQALTQRALDSNEEERVENLTAALALVRNRPFFGIDDANYAWAEHEIQNMVSAIADAAHLLARTHHEAGRYVEAIQVATLGLDVDPLSALLQRDALAAASARGDDGEYQRLRHRFQVRLEALDPDLEL